MTAATASILDPDPLDAMSRRYKRMGVDLDRPRMSGGALGVTVGDVRPVTPSNACDRWGSISAPRTQNPACSCCMCTAARADLKRKKTKRKKKR